MELRNQAAGRWPDIHNCLGIDASHLRNRHMPCPGCGGHDRFRYDDKDGRGTFYCGGGGDPVHGDGFELLSHIYGWDFKTAANEVRRVLGVTSGDYVKPERVKPQPVVRPPEVSKTQPYAMALWEGCNRDDAIVASHPYAIKKSISGASGAGRNTASGRLIGKEADCLIVPQRTLNDELIGVECINSEGVKQSFGKKGCLVLGNTLDKTLSIYIVEGWADGVATWSYFGNVVVVVVFGIGRQAKLADSLNLARPSREIIIVRDQ